MIAVEHPLVAEYLRLVAEYEPLSRRVEVCPVCEGTNFQEGTADVVRLKGCEVYLERPSPLIVCDECGMLMRPHVSPPAFYREYLNRFYDCVPDRVSDMSRWKAAERARILRGYKAQASQILEVSSYDGATLAGLMEAYAADGVGIEPTTGAARLSESILPAGRARVLNDVAEGALPGLRDHVFDIVVFSHAFRHISTPEAVLDALRHATALDAVILVDESDLLDLTSLNASPELLVRSLHVQKHCYYGFHNLTYLFERFGFQYAGRHISDDPSSHAGYCGVVFRKHAGVVPDRGHLTIARRASKQALGIYRETCTSVEHVKASLLKWG